MTVIHNDPHPRCLVLAENTVTFEAHDGDSIIFGHYPDVDVLAVGCGEDEVGSFPLEEFKKFARKILADELIEPPAPEWHEAKVIRGLDRGISTLFLRISDEDEEWVSDRGYPWSTEFLAKLVEDIEIVVGADDE